MKYGFFFRTQYYNNNYVEKNLSHLLVEETKRESLCRKNYEGEEIK